MWTLVRRTGLGLFFIGGLLLLAIELYVLADLHRFEYAPLLQLLGWRGLAFLLLLNAGLVLAVVVSLRGAVIASSSRRPTALVTKALLALWIVAVLWLLEWTFMEEPLTVRIASALVTEQDRGSAIARAIERARETGDLAVIRGAAQSADERNFALMLARIAINRPGVLDRRPIAEPIWRYCRAYAVEPALILSGGYVGSFYGEAVSGPMPFFAGLTAETFRDLLQLHLPTWFIENPLRVALIGGPHLENLFGPALGWKLRYAFHKATYDASVDPFETNLYSELFLVLKQYPDEFPELRNRDGWDDEPLGAAFRKLESHALRAPYDEPYAHAPVDGTYYQRYRDDLTAFARAAAYRLILDYDFAVKVECLLARYYSELYQERLEGALWARLEPAQKAVLILLLRDIYTHNVGRLAYNLYLLPELNTTPFPYVVEEANKNPDEVVRAKTIWVPPDRESLWGATTLKLRAFGEVWRTIYGNALPGVGPASTVEDAVVVLARHL